MIADTERTWLRACALWLARAGYTVTTADSPAALASALQVATPYSLRLIDAKLVAGDRWCAAPKALEDPTPGFLWREPLAGYSLIRSGPGTAVNCPRPRSPATLDTLLHYLLHPDTRLLDAALVGEIVGMSPTAKMAEAIVDRFTEETSTLVSVMNHAQALAEASAWDEAQHALLGCAAAIGAVGLLNVVSGFDVRSWPATAETAVVAPVTDIIAATERSLRRAVRAYFAEE